MGIEWDKHAHAPTPGAGSGNGIRTGEGIVIKALAGRVKELVGKLGGIEVVKVDE